MRIAAEKALNYLKDAWLWAADTVEKHPHAALALIVAFAALAVLW